MGEERQVFGILVSLNTDVREAPCWPSDIAPGAWYVFASLESNPCFVNLFKPAKIYEAEKKKRADISTCYLLVISSPGKKHLWAFCLLVSPLSACVKDLKWLNLSAESFGLHLPLTAGLIAFQPWTQGKQLSTKTQGLKKLKIMMTAMLVQKTGTPRYH